MFFSLFLASCTPAPPALSPKDSGLEGDHHPLVGQIWSTVEGGALTSGDLARTLASHRFVILGEVHDNPHHHDLQAWVLRALAEQSRLPGVTLEMISEDQAGALRLFYEQTRPDTDSFALFLNWDKSGWPDFDLYAPIVRAALRFELPIHWANLDREDVIAMYNRGWDALDDDLRQTLDLPAQLPETVAADLREDMAASHCHSLPPEQVARFAEIQYARDAMLAHRTATASIEQGGRHGAVLITGAGHARSDRGVPYHLNRLGALGEGRSSVISVGLVEVRAGATTPDAYDLPYDIVWFTPTLSRNDPCDAFSDPDTDKD